MPSLGPAEVLVILVVALLVFGPNKMPEIGRQVARGVREFRRVQQHLSSELQSVVADLDPTAPTPPPTASSGGDPVPTLPPKNDVVEPVVEPAAEPVVDSQPVAPAADEAPDDAPDDPPAVTPDVTPISPVAADESAPSPQSDMPGPIGETPASPPPEPA